MNKLKKDNVLNFPSKMTEIEREVEAIVFAAAETQRIETCLLYTSPSPRDS